MKNRLILLLLCLSLLVVSLSVAQAESVPVADPTHHLRLVADRTIQDSFPFDANLYDIALRALDDGSQQLDYRWQRSLTPIFSVTIEGEKARLRVREDFWLENYYDELRHQHDGMSFWQWPIEQKAWFATRLPSLIALDDHRKLQQYPDLNFDTLAVAPGILAHQHGLPDELSIPQEKALAIARERLQQEQALSTQEVEDLSLYQFYYVDQADIPHWVFRFLRLGVRLDEVWVNARSGQTTTLNYHQALAQCRQYLHAAKLGGVYAEGIDTARHETYYLMDEEGKPFWMFRFLDIRPGEDAPEVAVYDAVDEQAYGMPSG